MNIMHANNFEINKVDIFNSKFKTTKRAICFLNTKSNLFFIDKKNFPIYFL